MKKSMLSRMVLIFGLLIPVLGAASPFDNIYILGDSLSDQGNLYAATLPGTSKSVPCNAPPGNTSCQDLVTANTGAPANDHYYNGRFSNGPIYADILAQQLGLSLTPSSSGGNNFAYGGARTDYNRAEITAPIPDHGYYPQGHYPQGPQTGAPWSLQLEQQAFEARNIDDPKGLYIVWSGSNDVGDLISAVALHQITLQDALARLQNVVVTGIHDVIDAFVAAGAQHILVPNIPDFGKVPAVPSAARGLATLLSSTYNTYLNTMLDTFAGVNIIRVDIFSLVDDVAKNPMKYGFTNATDACYSGFVAPDINHTQTVCHTPSSYAFWDNEHPTTAFQTLIADDFLQAIPEPSALVNFLLGLGLLMVLRRTGLLHRDRRVATPSAG